MKYTIEQVREYISEQGYLLLDNEYKNVKVKLTIKSPEGFIFQCSFDNFRRGRREPQTRNRRMTEKSRKSYEDVKSIVEDNGFILLSDEYKNNRTPMKVICSNNHISYKSFYNISIGHGCRECGLTKRSLRKTTTEYSEFVNESRMGQYSLVGEYKGGNKKNTFRHKKCGNEFEMAANAFNSGQGCPICKSPRGERVIYNVLRDNDIYFKKEYSVRIGSSTKRFDFYLYDFKMVIEYDGRQHTDKSDTWFSEENVERDKQKNLWCNQNDIILIRVPHTINRPSDIIDYINEHSMLNLKNNKDKNYMWMDNSLEIAEYYLNNYARDTAVKYSVTEYYIERCFFLVHGMNKREYLRKLKTESVI